MADIRCALCSEPWDAYGVKNGDMDPDEAERFLAGQGCPSCAFGTRCPSCNGTGRLDIYSGGHRCKTCFDTGIVRCWSPRRATARYFPGHFYFGYDPNVRKMPESAFDERVVLGSRTFPERCETVETRDGLVDQFNVICPDCKAANDASCDACGGDGKLHASEDVALDAARDELDWSDEEPTGILIRRGLL